MYGVFLVIVGVTATAQVMLASVHVSTSALNQAVGTDTQVVRGFVDDLLKPADLTAPSIAADRQAALEAGLNTFITPRGIIRAEIRRLDGTDPRERRPDRRAARPELGRLADGAGRPARRSRSWPRPRARPDRATSARDR